MIHIARIFNKKIQQRFAYMINKKSKRGLIIYDQQKIQQRFAYSIVRNHHIM
jgi:hypothetical protein